MTSELAERATIIEMVRVYRQAVEDITGAFGVIAAAEQRLNAVFTMRSHRTFDVAEGSGCRTDFDKPERTIARLEREVWRTIVDRLELRRMMSVRAWRDMEKQLEDGELPELTAHNVSSMAKGFETQIPDMLAEAVEEVFDWLRPRNSEYKTNTEYEVGRKVILSYMVEERWSGGFEVLYNSQAQLTALENVFSALDGKGRISKSYYSLLSNAIKDSGESGKGETEYFRFRCFKNRNLHLEFKRIDLLQRFNAMAGGARLRRGA